MTTTIQPSLATAGSASVRLADANQGASYRDWIAFLKPRVLTLVVFTGMIGMMVAPGHLNPVLKLTAILCITAAAGACGAINMWYDRDIDSIMRRTRNRPIPIGNVTPDGALAFGVALAAASVIIMGLALNVAAAVMLAVSVGFYVVIYTFWLKRSTPQNIVIGGAAGAFPPLIGWMAVTGSMDPLPLILFGIIFIWTPPHFWSLALWANEDYTRAGVPMMPVVSGARETRRQILIYTLLLVPCSFLPSVIGFSGWLYTLSASVLGGLFLLHSYRVITDKQDALGVSLTKDAPARRAFKYSISYLFRIFGALALDRLVA